MFIYPLSHLAAQTLLFRFSKAVTCIKNMMRLICRLGCWTNYILSGLLLSTLSTKSSPFPGIYTVCHAKPDYPRSIWKLLVFTRYLSAFLYPPKQQVIQYRIADRNKKSGFVNFAWNLLSSHSSSESLPQFITRGIWKTKQKKESRELLQIVNS